MQPIWEQQIMNNLKSWKPYLNMHSTPHSEVIHKMRGIKRSNSVSISYIQSGNPQAVYKKSALKIHYIL